MKHNIPPWRPQTQFPQCSILGNDENNKCQNNSAERNRELFRRSKTLPIQLDLEDVNFLS